MERVELVGRQFELNGDNLKCLSEKEASRASCSGNACKDIDYQWYDDTNSYHFFNDGSKRVLLKVTSATYFGCSVYKTRRMRPGEEWDSGFYGLCSYEANYR